MWHMNLPGKFCDVENDTLSVKLFKNIQVNGFCGLCYVVYIRVKNNPHFVPNVFFHKVIIQFGYVISFFFGLWSCEKCSSGFCLLMNIYVYIETLRMPTPTDYNLNPFAIRYFYLAFK